MTLNKNIHPSRCTSLVLATFVIMCTHLDIRGRINHRKLLKSFSLRANATKLFNLEENHAAGSISCLHGFRALSILMIIYFHSYFFRSFNPTLNPPVFDEWLKNDKFGATVCALNIIVDSFLVMSACLTTRSMLKELDL